jgi:hypothetical protein
MGYVSAREMRAYLSEDEVLRWHLQHNHFPSVSVAFLAVAKLALGAARVAIGTDDAGLWVTQLTLPNGQKKTVAEIICGLHLEPFLEEP